MLIPESVFDTLNKSNALLLAEHRINKHFKTAHWSNAVDRVTYNADHVHTLSFYLQGGEGSRRIDEDRGTGHAGSLCILPQHNQSKWEISAPIGFAHLYFSDESIKQFAAATLDIDPRTVVVPELTFHDDTALVALVKQLFLMPESRVRDHSDSLGQEQIIQLIFEHLLSDRRYCLNHPVKLTGGLSPVIARRVKEYIQQHSNRALHLSELAEIAGLSDYHFLRMFKESTGFTPSDYVTHIRIEKSKQALSGQQPLAQVALDSGFSNQSHFTRTFKKWVGMTPGAFRSACN
ncbi:helix-turn-helix transcriptional regulator [Alkalimarinus coralli]|uniref:helix-turn-helix transcriptional regulator n=1 Tax=Alkalimarinus coralli TaxID=2935863 RepID=UPI00202B3A32|nr:AraC family transcriptional regulator [Alkalimarinus coralli]